MRAWPLIIGVLFSALLAGCSSGIETRELSKIKQSSERFKVETILGPPIESHSIKGETFYIYEYDHETPIKGPPHTADPMAQFGIVILWGVDRFFFRDKKKGYCAIVYSRDGKVTAHETNPDKEVALERLKLFMELRERATANNADADALYEFASRLNDPSEAWRFYCLAAHKNHGPAQFKIAKIYESGRNSVTKDMTSAYLWYSLARKNGVTEKAPGTKYFKTTTGWACCLPGKDHQEAVAESLNQEELLRAKQLVAEWHPNPAECELDKTDTTE